MTEKRNQKTGLGTILWGARFKKELHKAAKKFSYSLEVDHVLIETDIRVSIAHAAMLGKIGLISRKESQVLVCGLGQVLSILKKTDVRKFFSTVEDVHTLIQNELEQKIGKLARKLHTGRSRNDLVATSCRLYVKEKMNGVLEKIRRFQESLVKLAEDNETFVIPGYTHLQHAQAVLLAHHVLAYVEMLERDKLRILGLLERLDECPLGSCALAGSNLPLDRAYVAKMLGFRKPAANSIDAVGDRDFVLETLSDIALLMMHLSRFSEDLVLWSSSEFGFLVLPDEFSTGSSLMPQKKNPDMPELVRGKTGEVYGCLVSVLTMMKGLPLAYNRDMQEDKKPLVQSIRLAEGALELLTAMAGGIRFNRKACEQALKDSFLYATDIVDYLVSKKIPFRDAHDIVGKLVQHAVESHLNLSGVMFETYRKFSDKFGKDVFCLFDARHSVESKATLGSTNPRLVHGEIVRWKRALKSNQFKLASF